MANTKVSSEQIIDGLALGGNPTAATQTAGNNSTRIATTAYTDAAVTALIGGAPSTLDTLNEIAAAVSDDPDYVGTVNAALALKAPKANPTFTGAVTANGGVVVDTITIDGSTITSSGSLTLDLVGNLTIDVDGTVVSLSDGGVNFGQLFNSGSGNFNIYSPTSNQDIIFRGNDGGSGIVALTLDMSAAGAATFNSSISADGQITSARGSDTGTYGFRHEGAGKYMRMGVANASFAYFETDANGGFSFEGDVSVANKIIHAGDTNTYIDFTSDVLDLYSGGLLGVRVQPTAVTINEAGVDADFRVESDALTHALFVEGNTSNVYMGSSANIEGGRVQVTSAKTLTANIPYGMLGVNDNTAMAQGVGGAINFCGMYNSNGAITSLGSVEGYKTLSNNGNYDGTLVLKARAHGGNQIDKLRLNSTEAVFNEDGVDTDFRVESDNDDHALFVDGLTGNVYGSKTGSSMTTAGWGLARNGGSEFVSQGNNITPLKVASADDSYISLIEFFTNNGTQAGYILGNGSALSLVSNSDYRLKEDWKPIENATETFMQLKPCNFAWKADGSRTDGFLAHELQEVVPNAAHGEKDAVDSDGNPKYQGIDQSNLVPLLVAALQEAIARIEILEG